MPQHRDGEKIRGSHTTCIDLAGRVVDVISKIPEINGISLSYIESGQGKGGSSQRVKIGDMSGGILLKVRQSYSTQALRIFTTESQSAKLSIARVLRSAGIPISFHH